MIALNPNVSVDVRTSRERLAWAGNHCRCSGHQGFTAHFSNLGAEAKSNDLLSSDLTNMMYMCVCGPLSLSRFREESKEGGMSSSGTVSMSYCQDWRDHVSEHCRPDAIFQPYYYIYYHCYCYTHANTRLFNSEKRFDLIINVRLAYLDEQSRNNFIFP